MGSVKTVQHNIVFDEQKVSNHWYTEDISNLNGMLFNLQETEVTEILSL